MFQVKKKNGVFTLTIDSPKEGFVYSYRLRSLGFSAEGTTNRIDNLLEPTVLYGSDNLLTIFESNLQTGTFIASDEVDLNDIVEVEEKKAPTPLASTKESGKTTVSDIDNKKE